MAERSVRMSGIVLASLMFQHVNSDSDAEGLILGEFKFEENVIISDSQVDHIDIEEVYNIQKHVTCHKHNNFYNAAGEVDQDVLKHMLADNKQESVIGWYRQRRNTDQRMTFREKLVHENLKGALSNPHMVFLLLTPSQLTSTGSTHRTEYAAFISHCRRVLNVPVLVNNLGLLEQLSYWKVSAPCSAAGYTLTMKKHGSKFFNSSGSVREVIEVDKMNDSLQCELQEACSAVEESERQVERLLADVSALRKRVADKRCHKLGEDADVFPLQPKRNLQLQVVLEALFTCSPLFQTQILTLGAVPVTEQSLTLEAVPMTEQSLPPEAVHVLEDSHSTEQTDEAVQPGRSLSRKRLNKTQPSGDKKRLKC